MSAVRHVWLATYELPQGEEFEPRQLFVVAPNLKRACFIAVRNEKEGESLVSLARQKDAVA